MRGKKAMQSNKIVFLPFVSKTFKYEKDNCIWHSAFRLCIGIFGL